MDLTLPAADATRPNRKRRRPDTAWRELTEAVDVLSTAYIGHLPRSTA